jgi:hypothetical protein
MTTRRILLTELEEKLAAADGAQLRARLMGELQAMQSRLSAQLGHLVSKDEHACLSACAAAVVSAQDVLLHWVTGTAQFSDRPR